MRQFERYMKEFSDLQGWFEPPSIALWDCLFGFQRKLQHNGHLLEIGVWKGRSAALMALHCEPNELCIFVDTKATEDARARISRVTPDTNCIYMQQTSERLLFLPTIQALGGKVRWVHIDGEHTSEAVTRDLRTADYVLERGGLVVVDDFFSPGYPQVTKGVFQFLAFQPNCLSLFLCGFNKGYLCRPVAARQYLEQIRASLYDEMSSRGFSQVTIWKTTEPDDMNAFGITERYVDFSYRGLDWDPKRFNI